jgi:hypothetical protein
MKYLFIYFIFSFVLFACNQNDSTTNATEDVEIEKSRSDFNQDSFFFSLMNSIQSDTSLYTASSLDYSKNNSETYQVDALVDENNNICMLKNTITDSTREIIEEFYYLNAKKRISSRLVSSYENEIFISNQFISFYNDSGEVAYTGFRSHYNMDSLTNLVFSKYEVKLDHNDQLAQNIIQQKGSFETNFRGFFYLEMYDMNYLIVGSDDGSISSSLAISEESPLLKMLKSNEEKYKGTPLRVEFTKVNQTNGFSFQSLLNLSINPVK